MSKTETKKPIESTARVYRESPLWDTVDRWFKLSDSQLASLYVETWSRTFTEEADYHSFSKRDMDEIRKNYDFEVVIIC